MDYRGWFEKNYPFLSGYGLWLRGGELNTVPASEFDSRPFRVLITRLSTYRDTADSFTHKLLYQIVRRIDGAYPDCAYLPPPKDAALFDRAGVPWLLGAASKRPARDFSVIACSLAIVQEIINIRTMLEKSGIPAGKRERLDDPSCPLVILGGASALYTSALYGIDPLVDGIFIGEDAGTIERLLCVCRDGCGSGKREILAALKTIPGFIEPDNVRGTAVFRPPRLSQGQLLETGPVLCDESCIGKGNLQISEGCTCFCSFCAESFGRKPYREFEAETLGRAALRMKAAMGVHDLELYSFNFTMHRDFYGILATAAGLFPSLGLKSQRIDSIAADPAVLKFLHAVGKTSITCGIEGISQRLRRYLHKSLDEQALAAGLQALLSSPLRELKIFLVATGLEQRQDYDDLRTLLDYLHTVMAAAGRAPRIIFSMTILVRFPFTPLEFEDAPAPAAAAAVLSRTRQIVEAAHFEFRQSSDANDYWLSQVMVRAENEVVADAVGRAARETGFVYYREIPQAFVTSVKKHLALAGIAPDTLLQGFPPSQRSRRPWCRIAAGVDPDFLAAQWEAAKRFEERGRCGGTQLGEGSCVGCGACADAKVRQAVTAKIQNRHPSLEKFIARLRSLQEQAVAQGFRVTIGNPLRGVPRALRGTALARGLMLADGRLVKEYWGGITSFSADALGSDRVIGDDVVSLSWQPDAIPILRDLIADAAFCVRLNTLLDGWMVVHTLAEPAPLSIASVVFRSPFTFDPAGYCAEKSLKYTLKKTGQDTIVCEFSKDSLKKKILRSCVAEILAEGRTAVNVEPGPKFNAEEFARAAFTLTHEEEWVRTEIVAMLK